MTLLEVADAYFKEASLGEVLGFRVWSLLQRASLDESQLSRWVPLWLSVVTRAA